MRKILFLLFVVFTFSNIIAQDDIQDYKLEVGQFDRLRVTDNVNVVYRCLPDSSGYVQYRGSKDFADAFIITPKDGQLRIQVSTEDVGKPDLPVLYVYSDFLTSVENSSNFTLVVENPVPCAEFKATQIGNGMLNVENLKSNKVEAALNTGNGSVNVSGSCREATFKMIGTGTISADRLEAEKVQCKILGSGTIGCWAVDVLNVKGLGSTKIYYKGEPVIKKVGGGKLFPLPSAEEHDTIVSVEEIYPEEKTETDE
ncbi:MAG: DUF2807 domain-containing protein [Muribaculaceae bacterium]|nr:DUF2807 domain-containing protein [Muribaculaceae bacterium]MDE6753141.1 DUF2807 domain-containing protein [Muribaculaceae bacterium]